MFKRSQVQTSIGVDRCLGDVRPDRSTDAGCPPKTMKRIPEEAGEAYTRRSPARPPQGEPAACSSSSWHCSSLPGLLRSSARPLLPRACWRAHAVPPGRAPESGLRRGRGPVAKRTCSSMRAGSHARFGSRRRPLRPRPGLAPLLAQSWRHGAADTCALEDRRRRGGSAALARSAELQRGRRPIRHLRLRGARVAGQRCHAGAGIRSRAAHRGRHRSADLPARVHSRTRRAGTLADRRTDRFTRQRRPQPDLRRLRGAGTRGPGEPRRRARIALRPQCAATGIDLSRRHRSTRLHDAGRVRALANRSRGQRLLSRRLFPDPRRAGSRVARQRRSAPFARRLRGRGERGLGRSRRECRHIRAASARRARPAGPLRPSRPRGRGPAPATHRREHAGHAARGSTGFRACRKSRPRGWQSTPARAG